MPELKAFLAGGGEAAELIRARDWDDTPLGAIRSWPQPLRRRGPGSGPESLRC